MMESIRESIPDFETYYRALWEGREPFPWQVRLAQRVAREGWPSLLDLPTGVGKTSALDIAVHALAVAPDRMPRRCVLVVDRRIVVDQAGEHARLIAARLAAATAGPLRAVADALRVLFGGTPDDPPLEVAVMRGGMPRENDWASRPDVPMIGVSTVDQVGSRLLFRGYGVSHRARSIHAGLLGADTLVLLDEVHLSVPFAQTLRRMRGLRRATSTVLPDRFHVVEMSATPGHTEGEAPFTLDARDRAHPVLSVRLGARKPTRLECIKVTGKEEPPKLERIAKQAVRLARELQREGAPVVAIVLNRVESARLAAREAKAVVGTQAEVLLVTGRMRPVEKDRLVAQRLVALAGAGRDRQQAVPTIVVATQSIEAGADLDFDAMVTECASLDALRQRVGRVDRRGERGTSAVIVLGRSDQLAPDAVDPVYGPALSRTWSWLESVEDLDLGVAGFDRASATTPVPPDALAPRPDAPVLLPMHVDLFAQTSPSAALDPDPALWLHGPESDGADVQVLWRSDVALDAAADASIRLDIVRPSTLECVSVPIGAARRWLGAARLAPVADVEFTHRGSPEDERAIERELDRRTVPIALRWDGDEAVAVAAKEIRPGDILVVPSSRGGLDEWGGFDAESHAPVPDVAELAQWRANGRAFLRIGTGSTFRTTSAIIGSPPTRDAEVGIRDRAAELRAWVAGWPQDPPADFIGSPAEWHAWRGSLAAPSSRLIVEGASEMLHGTARRSVTRRRGGAAAPVTESELSGFGERVVELTAHANRVRDLTGRFAERTGLPAAMVDDLRLAAHCHDLGKHDPRFQLWLRGGDAAYEQGVDVPLAKGMSGNDSPLLRERARSRAGYPRGERHELLSVSMLDGSALLSGAHDPDLVLHLVASHHGWCRPFPPLLDDPHDAEVGGDVEGERLVGRTRHRLARLDSGVSDRFWSLNERYGAWGLAWLESLIRLADHLVSAQEEEN